jgi:hypothetical protein
MVTKFCCNPAFFPLWLTEPEGAAWVGAVVSFLAVAAALGIAITGEVIRRREEKRRRREARALALISLGHGIAPLLALAKLAEMTPEARRLVVENNIECAQRALERAFAAAPAEPEFAHTVFSLEAACSQLKRSLPHAKGNLSDETARGLWQAIEGEVREAIARVERFEADFPNLAEVQPVPTVEN